MFKIENDLDFNGVDFSSIGLNINNEKVGFSGQIDGNNKTIRILVLLLLVQCFNVSLYKWIIHYCLNFVIISGKQFVAAITSYSSNLIFKNINMKKFNCKFRESRNGMYCGYVQTS